MKIETQILQLENFFKAVQNYLILKDSWTCYIECKMEPGVNQIKSYICLFGENSSNKNNSSGQHDLRKSLNNLDDDVYADSINMLNLFNINSAMESKRVTISQDQKFETFLDKYKPLFSTPYKTISFERTLRTNLAPKTEEGKQTKI